MQDYIIVGAGICGCVVASRLNQAGYSVLLLEAGSDPSGKGDTYLSAFSLLGSDLDYAFQTAPQLNTANRVHTLHSGKALGGGSAINFGGWMRADAADYDAWGSLVGDSRWNYEGLLPYFRKSEFYLNNSRHGSDGPIHVGPISADPARAYPLREPIRKAWEELGVSHVTLEKWAEGYTAGLSEILESSKDNKRQNAHTSYDLTGVEILTGATVARVLFEGHKAVGVELIDGRRLKAGKEVILAAGVYRTPQILMLSGVGPAEVLAEHKIAEVYKNENVGKNLFEHFAVYLNFKLKNPERGLSLGSPKLTDAALYGGLPFDWVINEPFGSRNVVENFSIYAPGPIGGVPFDGTHISSSTMLLLPASRGTVSLRSNSPTDYPIIDPNYLDSEDDMTALVYGARRLVTAMLGTESLKVFVDAEAPPFGQPLTPGSPDSDYEDRIRQTGAHHPHSMGTAAMGSVVDCEGRVLGVEGLRVVDASGVPVPLGGHPQATLYGMAEQLADMIKQ